MNGTNDQNSQIQIRNILDECYYDPNMKDYVTKMIMKVINYPKKTNQPRFFVRNINQDKIIMIWYPMSVPFAKRNIKVPINIFIPKNIFNKSPQIFIELVKGSAINGICEYINQITGEIMTNTLRNWNKDSNIENVMNEIFESFSNTFPFIKHPV